MFKGIGPKDWLIGFFTGGLWILYKLHKNGAPLGKIFGGYLVLVILVGLIGGGDKKENTTSNTETKTETVVEKKVDKVEAERIAKEKAESERIAKEEEAKKKVVEERNLKEKTTYKIIQAFSYFRDNECDKQFIEGTQFGDFSNVELESCTKSNGKLVLMAKVKLDKPFSHTNAEQTVGLMNGVVNELGIERKKLIEYNICKFTAMPKGFSCGKYFKDINVLISAYDGIDTISINYIQN